MNGMREILEDSALIYRQELESLFAILVPGVILGPGLVILAASGVKLGLALVPIIFLVCLVLFAASLVWAGNQLANSAPDPMPLLLLHRAPNIVLSAAPLGLLLVAVSACAIVIADQGFGYLALLAVAAGVLAAVHWISRHPYELPLVVVYDASARQATAASARLPDDARQWTLRLLITSGAPLLVAGLIAIWMAWALAPMVGVAVFLLALTLWMPFGSLCLVSGCARLLSEGESIRSHALSRSAAR
jgi:hypothetical protein